MYPLGGHEISKRFARFLKNLNKAWLACGREHSEGSTKDRTHVHRLNGQKAFAQILSTIEILHSHSKLSFRPGRVVVTEISWPHILITTAFWLPTLQARTLRRTNQVLNVEHSESKKI